MSEKKAKHTPGEWKLANDAQGGCMVMHPKRKGVAIASLTNSFKPANGFHDDWMVYGKDGMVNLRATQKRIDERNANARLIAAAPDLLAACELALSAFENNNCIDWSVLENAIAKAKGE